VGNERAKKKQGKRKAAGKEVDKKTSGERFQRARQ
jgi:hypothetical protein